MQNIDSEIIYEIVPRSEIESIYIVEREKRIFDFPIHTHREIEINLLVGCNGAIRVVGDSIEELTDFDFVLIGSGLEHGWIQNNCRSEKIKEITIQLSPDYFVADYLKKNYLDTMYNLMVKSANGIKFSDETLLENYATIKSLTTVTDNFERMILINRLFYNLSKSNDYRVLASESFSGINSECDSRRLSKIRKYINDHYTEQISVPHLAEIVGMTPSAFARFFKQRTSRTVGSFIMETRLGVAIRQLIDTKKSISEICYESGFSNQSHFSRCFRQSKGCTPSEFRHLYSNNKR